MAPRNRTEGEVGELRRIIHLDTPPAELRRVHRPDRLPRATVVIPARNEEHWIERCLSSVLAQDEPNIEVLVVDGASTDRTPAIVAEIARNDPRVRLLGNPRGIIPASLNVALQQARAPHLVRIDAHATVPPDYVRHAVELLETGEYGAVGGRKEGIGLTPAGQAIAIAMGSRFGVGNSAYHYGNEARDTDHVPFGAYSIELARKLGGWDERLRVNQDFAFDFELRRSGHRIRFDPKLRIDWHSRQSIGDFFRQYFRYGRGKARVIRIHPRSAAPRHLAAPALVAALAGALAISPFVPLASLALVGPYVVGLVAASIATARRAREKRARFLVPLAFLTMHVGWGLGFWRGVADWARPIPPRAGDVRSDS